MFGKIYKEAVNECTPNYDLKKALMFKAAKAKRTIPIYKYSLSAAAVIILVVSAGFAGNYLDMIGNKSIEQEVITKADLSGEEKGQGGILETEGVGFSDTVSDKENSTGDLPEATAVADASAIERVLANSPDKEDKKRQKASVDLKADAEKKAEAVMPVEAVQPEKTVEPAESAQINVAKIQNEDITENAEADKNPEFKPDVQPETAAEEVAVSSEEENYGISMASETEASYMKAAKGSSGGSGGGSGGGSAMMNTKAYDVWNATRYTQYLGINIIEKVAGAVSAITEKEVVFEEDGSPSDDTWTFNCGGVVIKTTKETENLDRSGEVIEINSVKVYKEGDKYEFIYKGVYFEVTGSENSEHVIKQILS